MAVALMIHTRKLSQFKNGQLIVRKGLDQWRLDGGMISRKDCTRISIASAFTSDVIQGNYRAAWNRIEESLGKDEKLLKYFSTNSCSLFLKSLPMPSIGAQSHWLRTLMFSTAMKGAGHELSGKDCIILFNRALYARDYPSVEALMRELETTRPDMLNRVEVWNAYIQASCHAYPLFWPQKQTEGFDLKIPLPQIVRKMEMAGVVLNSQTYELIVLAFARQGKMDLVHRVIQSAWSSQTHPKHSLMYPSSTTLMAIIEAYAFNGLLLRGINRSMAIQKKYRLAPLDAKEWVRILSLTLVADCSDVDDCSDVGLFEQVWGLAVKSKTKPSLEMWTLCVQYYLDQAKYELLAAEIPQILTIKGGKRLAKRVLKSCVVALVENGQALEALRLMEDWTSKGIDVRGSMDRYIKRKAGISCDQLQMYKEDDDDEDWW